MDQQEFDKKVSDIFVTGSEFFETWDKIGKLFLSLESKDKFLAFRSELLKNWINLHNKEIIEYILSK